MHLGHLAKGRSLWKMVRAHALPALATLRYIKRPETIPSQCQWNIYCCCLLSTLFFFHRWFLWTLISATGLNMWVSLFSTGIICTVYTTVVRTFFVYVCKTEQIFFSDQNILSWLLKKFEGIIQTRYISLDSFQMFRVLEPSRQIWHMFISSPAE